MRLLCDWFWKHVSLCPVGASHEAVTYWTWSARYGTDSFFFHGERLIVQILLEEQTITVCVSNLECLQPCSVCDPCKNILHIQVLLFIFSNPTNKTKPGTWETTNSNPPGPIKLSRQSTAASLAKMQGQNHFALLHPIFFCRVTYWALVELLLV
jgi:hypothetical protein